MMDSFCVRNNSISLVHFVLMIVSVYSITADKLD